MYQHILIATDGSDLAEKGVDAGIALAAALRAAVTLVTVSEPWHEVMPGDPTGLALSCELLDEYRKASADAAQKILSAAAAKAAKVGVETDSVHVPERVPADGILETAAQRGADLIVMASHGRRGLGRLLVGSQTRAVVTHSTLPVLVVR